MQSHIFPEGRLYFLFNCKKEEMNWWVKNLRQDNKVGRTAILWVVLLLIGAFLGAAGVYYVAKVKLNPYFEEKVPTSKLTPVPSLSSSFSSVPALPYSFSDVVEKVKPAVVNIYTEQEIKRYIPDWWDFFERDLEDFFGWNLFEPFRKLPRRRVYREKITNLGSGVIVDSRGYILTNNHVISGADVIWVKLSDGSTYKASVVGKDERTDLALLKISRARPFPVAVLGDSDLIKVGDVVLAIGNPFGYSETVTLGIISALGRGLGEDKRGYYIQTDAAINPGNSGGPLVNMRGEVIGINTAIKTAGYPGNIGIGFAIPSNIAKKVFKELQEKGKVIPGYLGVTLQDLTPDLAEYFGVSEGVLITQVMKNSPAEKAGLRAEDIIVSYQGKKVTSASQLSALVGTTPPGKTVEIGIIRDKKPLFIRVTIAERTEEIEAKLQPAEEKIEDPIGLEVEEITPKLARERGLSRTEGVVVRRVIPGSIAEQVGIQENDIILEVNRKPINTIADYKEIISKYKKGTTLVMRLQRDGAIIYITAKID